jgi:hypothetical protein
VRAVGPDALHVEPVAVERLDRLGEELLVVLASGLLVAVRPYAFDVLGHARTHGLPVEVRHPVEEACGNCDRFVGPDRRGVHDAATGNGIL